MLELHCEICANAGGMARVSRDTLIATFEPENVKLPLDGSMFNSPIPARNVPPPWQPGTTWDFMLCPRGRVHLPWMGLGEEPVQLLTNRGVFALSDNGLEQEEFKHQATEEELDQEWYERVRQSMSDADTEVQFIKEQRKKGKSYKEIGRILGKSKDTIARKIRGR